MKSVDFGKYLSDCGRYLLEVVDQGVYSDSVEEEDRAGTAWYIVDREEHKTLGPYETLQEAEAWINAQ